MPLNLSRPCIIVPKRNALRIMNFIKPVTDTGHLCLKIIEQVE